MQNIHIVHVVESLIGYLLSSTCRTAPFLNHRKNGSGLPVALQMNCRSWPSSSATSKPSSMSGAVSPPVIDRRSLSHSHCSCFVQLTINTLSGVSYGSVYEQTHSRQCCNLFISWLWTQPVIVLPSVARAYDNQSTVHRDWQLGGYSSARVRNIWAINRVLLRISIWFSCPFDGFHVANRAIRRLLLLHRYMRCFSAFLQRYSRARPLAGR